MSRRLIVACRLVTAAGVPVLLLLDILGAVPAVRVPLIPSQLHTLLALGLMTAALIATFGREMVRATTLYELGRRSRSQYNAPPLRAVGDDED